MICDALPEPLARRMQRILQEDFENFCFAFSEKPPVSVRINPYKPADLSTLPFGEAVLWDEYGFYLREKYDFLRDPLWHAGAYYVQGASSMSLTPFLKEIFKEYNAPKILDFAAAPGGKSLLATTFLPENAILVSNEPHPKRVHILYENIAKFGHENVLVTKADPNKWKKLPPYFDIIILDAPCSAEGMFRKHPKFAKQWTPKSVLKFQKLQKHLIETAANLLKPQGTLIYSTCTYSEEENEAQIRFLLKNFNMELREFPVPEPWNWQKTFGGFRLYPHKIKGEGFFISVLRKNGSTNRKKLKKQTFKIHKEELFGISRTFSYKNKYYHPATRETAEVLEHYGISLYSAGLEVAERKHKNLLPAPALALWRNFSGLPFEKRPLTRKEALEYLSGNPSFPYEKIDKKFLLVFYKDLPLGFVKVLANRYNSLYPSYWRIRR